MAFSMKVQVVSVLIVAVAFVLCSAHGVSCQEGESSAAQTADKKPLVEELGAGHNANRIPQPQAGGLPVVVIRQQADSSAKPDIYLGWLNWDGMSSFKPFLNPFFQQISPYSQQLSSVLLDTLPGASSIYSNFNQVGNQLSGLNPFSQIMGSFGSGSLFGRR